jgi:uncharacterized linocin/CFP29 family protein
MSDANQTNYPGWTEDQWGRVHKAVAEEAQKARVAAQFLPLFGPVDSSVVAVPDLLLGDVPNPPWAPLRQPNRLDVDSTPNTQLATLSVQIPLATHEVADPEQLAALSQFRRAAVTLARVEDALIFNGQPGPAMNPFGTAALRPVFVVTGGGLQAGLVPAGAAANAAPVPANIPPRANRQIATPAGVGIPPGWAGVARQANMANWGETVVAQVCAAIGDLELAGHSGPFACFLAPDVFEAVHTPPANMILPRDRILPFLGGDYLRRSSMIPNGYGIIVALGGGPVEIVVASDISVRYLQQTTEPRFLFRVSERIALRVKEWNAVAVLHP